MSHEDFPLQPHQVPPDVSQRFARYLKARDRAESSRRLEDGVAAGLAWASFLRLFTAEDA